jgi:hypothetical protein
LTGRSSIPSAGIVRLESRGFPSLASTCGEGAGDRVADRADRSVDGPVVDGAEPLGALLVSLGAVAELQAADGPVTTGPEPVRP